MHHLLISCRYESYQLALTQASNECLQNAICAVCFAAQYANIVSKYEEILSTSHLKRRVTHHDTKISNVLFDAHDKGMCVIDLDTVMTGYYISDVGERFFIGSN